MENTSILFASKNDLNWLAEKDTPIDKKAMKKKIMDQQILICKSKNEILGWLRYSLFWDEIPFINLLFVLKEHRNHQIGKKLVQFWELAMKKDNHKMVLTSAQADESAQHFFRKLQYVDAGSLLFPDEPLEIIFLKAI